MYDLNLTTEQIEIRDTVREFVEGEIKPVMLHPDQLQASGRALPLELLEKASRIGLRTLALSEEAGGAGADTLTSCLVMEELGAGDVNLAAVLGETSLLAGQIFDRAMTPEQRERFLPGLVSDDRYHLALAALEPDPDLGWKYHRALAAASRPGVTAARQANGDWVINGSAPFTANALVAKLIMVEARVEPAQPEPGGVITLLVPRETPGLEVCEPDRGSPPGDALLLWYHGSRGDLVLKNCRVPASHVLQKTAGDWLAADRAGRGSPQVQAMNLGVGRAACEAAIEYAKLRVQGGRPIIEHQAIGTILADIAVKLEVARSMIWKAAWAADHSEAYEGRSLPDLPLQTVARVFVSEVVHEAAEGAAECFGAMGVMLDMPLPKYVHDALVFIHSGSSNSVAKFRIAEAVAGYRREAPATIKAAA